MRINRHNRCECPWREILSATQIKSLVLRLWGISGIAKILGPSKKKLNTDGHQIPPVIAPTCPSWASLCPRRTLNQGYEFSAHRDPNIIPVYQILTAVSDILVVVCLRLAPWSFIQIKKCQVLLRGRIKVVLSKPVYHGVKTVFSWGSQSPRDSHNQTGLRDTSLSRQGRT